MASLAGTTWTLQLGSAGNEKVTFNSDGTATFGGPTVFYWGETTDGNWMASAAVDFYHNGNYRALVYYGSHSDGHGTGFFSNGSDGAKVILSPLTMVKS